jgi:hypothetical protein
VNRVYATLQHLGILTIPISVLKEGQQLHIFSGVQVSKVVMLTVALGQVLVEFAAAGNSCAWAGCSQQCTSQVVAVQGSAGRCTQHAEQQAATTAA